MTKKEIVQKRHEFFKEIWRKRKHVSEVSSKFLGYEPKTYYFHHIFPKNKYKDLEFIEENIVLLTFEEHAKVESDKYFYEKINKKREQLKTKYNL